MFYKIWDRYEKRFLTKEEIANRLLVVEGEKVYRYNLQLGSIHPSGFYLQSETCDLSAMYEVDWGFLWDEDIIIYDGSIIRDKKNPEDIGIVRWLPYLNKFGAYHKTTPKYKEELDMLLGCENFEDIEVIGHVRLEEL